MYGVHLVSLGVANKVQELILKKQQIIENIKKNGLERHLKKEYKDIKYKITIEKI